jgi:predicted RNA-binding protein with PIN domain
VSAAYRDHPAWRTSLDAAAGLYRTAAQLTGPSAPRLAEQLTHAAAEIPSRVARSLGGRGQSAGGSRQKAGGSREEAGGSGGGQAPAPDAQQVLAALHDAEALLEIAVRLNALPGAALPAHLRSLDSVAGALAASPPSEKGSGQRAEGGRPPSASVGQKPSVGTAPRPAGPPQHPTPTPTPTPPTPNAQRPTPDRLLVDGCNFLGRVPGFLLGDEESRDRLLFRLQEYGRAHPAHKLTVFFDGQHASRRLTAGVEERVTSGLRTADEVILEHLRTLPGRERPRCTLVTDDRALAEQAKREGIRVEATEWLAERLARRPQSDRRAGAPGLSSPQVAEWEEFFSRPPKRPGK